MTGKCEVAVTLSLKVLRVSQCNWGHWTRKRIVFRNLRKRYGQQLNIGHYQVFGVLRAGEVLKSGDI